jgi:plastocyanin
MKTWLLLSCLALAWMPPARAGTITGVVTGEGGDPNPAAPNRDKYESRKFKFVERIDYSKLRDFVVHIEQLRPASADLTSRTASVVIQKDAVFTPHMLAIVAGTTVEWPNNDNIFHNVFSFSESRQFDLGLYKNEIKRVKFDKPGRVDIFCSIHKDMHCIILVLENPYFAVANTKGDYTILNVPPGTYSLRAWHERLPSQSKTIKVPDSGSVKVDFTLSVKNLPKY